ncbi:MAG TPA: hypothetical protein VHV75_07910 [Solirubrobacteraceae bacterium]|jgi:hypothetical protein|nr:hypothetical protein [Solirubrobacteraceae bacterium]
MAYVVFALLLLGVVWLVSGPLRKAAAAGGSYDDPELESMQRIDLEAARDAKYREIRDAELDHQTGKLSDEDYLAIDSTLRSEAIELLHELDAVDDAEAPDEDATLHDE